MHGWRRFIALGVLVSGFAIAAAAKPVVPWLIQNSPPAFSYDITRPPESAAELGPGDRAMFLRLLVEQLPQYQHVFIELSLPRFELMLSQGQTICSVLHKRLPERLGKLYFTPMYPAISARLPHLIVRRDSLARFQALGSPIPLGKVLASTELRGLVERQRSFGSTLDGTLKPRLGKTLDTVVVLNKSTLLSMLLAGRMDYTLEYPEALPGLLPARQVQELIALPIAEAYKSDFAYASCSRTSEGLVRIQAIDAAVRRLAQDPQRDLLLRHWLGEGLGANDRTRLERYLTERAQRGPMIE
ncbi:MAG: hypothetical protein ACOVLH_14315 [Roseateles sp.]|jgi:uncharacterized protein (TIGR02285 family)